MFAVRCANLILSKKIGVDGPSTSVLLTDLDLSRHRQYGKSPFSFVQNMTLMLMITNSLIACLLLAAG